jgi:phosphatidylglycerophosphate synthase
MGLIENIYSERPSEHFKHKSEPWSVVFIGRIFGVPLARAIAWLPFKIHPNVLTILTVPISFIAGFCFFNNLLIWGAIFYFIGYIIDCADGTLARLTNTVSKGGERLDFYTDILNNIFMYFGLWYSQYYLVGQWVWGGSIISAHYLIMAFGYMFLTKLTYRTISPRICSYYMHADEGFLTFFVAPITGYFTIIFPILVGMQFISYLILFVTQDKMPDIRANIKKVLKF